METTLQRAPAVRVNYVRLGSGEPQVSGRFAADILGLQRGAEKDGEIAFRADQFSHSLSFIPGSVTDQSTGIELYDQAAFDRVEIALRDHGFDARRATPAECERRYVKAALLTCDGTGNAIDLVLRPLNSGRRYFPSRDAGITGLASVGLRTTKPERDLVLWTQVLGAQIRDWTGDITYLGFDSKHHRIALYPAEIRGLLYVAYEVEGLDQIMQNSYFMQDRQIKIIQGPGRQAASSQIFLHFQGPGGIIFSYATGMAEIDASRHRPRQFPASRESLCAWGSTSTDVPELEASSVNGAHSTLERYKP